MYSHQSQVKDFDPSCQLLAPFSLINNYLFKMDIVLDIYGAIEHFIPLTTHTGS